MNQKLTKVQQAFLPSRSMQFYVGIACLIMLSFATVLLPRDLFLQLSREDGFFENLGALFFLLTSILFFILFFQQDRFGNANDKAFFNSRSKRYFFFLMGLLFFIMMGEEISWGQRIFGFATPEGMSENLQGEANIHNLPLFHHYGEGKELKTGIAALFTAKKMFVVAFVSYLFLLPLLYKLDWVKNLVDRFYIPVPLIHLGVLFLFNTLIFRMFKAYYGYDKIGRSLSEIEEFNLALVLLFLPLMWFTFTKVSSNK